jgi:hypothetical protein
MSTQLSRAEDRIKVLDDQLSHLEEYLKESRILAYNLALEKAAQMCDSEATCEGIAQKCAVAIRAMKHSAP